MQIGAQLYSAHKRLKTLEDLDAGLKKVADIGYRSVQISGVCAYEPEWMRDKLQENGLTCAITHIALDRIMDDAENLIKEHEIFGCKNIGIGMMPKTMRGTMEGYIEFRNMLITAGKKFKDLGATLHYHNHQFEFDLLEGKSMMERLIEDIPEDILEFTLDLGWADAAGADVLKLIDTLKGRISRVHLKDYLPLPTDRVLEPQTAVYLRPIYEGQVNYDAIIKALEPAGVEYMLVEQDHCYGEDEYDCLRRSYDNVVSRFPHTK